MNSQSDCVILDIKTFNRFKNSEVKSNLVIDRLFEMSQLSDSKEDLVFNSKEELSELLHLAYPERFKNRLEELQEFVNS